MFERPLEDHEWPDPDPNDSGDDWGSGTDVVDCPHCDAEVYEDAVRCPVCGEYITHATNAWVGKSPLWVVLGLTGVIAVIFALVR